MKSTVVKRSIVVAGHKTSVSLEDAFWQCLKDIASADGRTVSDLIGQIDGGRHHGNLSSAIRLFVLDHFKGRVGQTGHRDPSRVTEAAGLAGSVLSSPDMVRAARA